MNATAELLATLRDDAATEADMQRTARKFFDAIAIASVEEASAALAELAPALLLPDIGRATMAALVCGALVEFGCDAEPVTTPLNQRLDTLLTASARLAEACLLRMPQRIDEEEIIDDRFEDVRRDVARSLPDEDAAWRALDNFWQPALGIYLASPQVRAAGRRLAHPAALIAPHHEGGYWLKQVLAVPDGESLLVLEPASGRGIRARMTGIVDNFQLNVLLMDAFPRGRFGRRRVSKRAVEVARGEGPQQTGDTITGAWNLYSWLAIMPGLRLPDPSDHAAREHWIWNEGTPADIPVFQDHRVVLLGPPSYERNWQNQRIFDKLPASLEVEQILDKSQVHDWLSRMLAAKEQS